MLYTFCTMPCERTTIIYGILRAAHVYGENVSCHFISSCMHVGLYIHVIVYGQGGCSHHRYLCWHNGAGNVECLVTI